MRCWHLPLEVLNYREKVALTAFYGLKVKVGNDPIFLFSVQTCGTLSENIEWHPHWLLLNHKINDFTSPHLHNNIFKLDIREMKKEQPLIITFEKI